MVLGIPVWLCALGAFVVGVIAFAVDVLVRVRARKLPPPRGLGIGGPAV